MITAIVFVKADVARIPEVAEAIAALDGVSEVYSVTGQIDLIALVRVRDHEDVADVVADRLNKVAGRDRPPRPTSRSAPTPATTSRRRSPSAWTELRPVTWLADHWLDAARLGRSAPARLLAAAGAGAALPASSTWWPA